MLSVLSSKKTVNISIDDYALRMVEHAGGDLTRVKRLEEIGIPKGLLEHGRIMDEMGFYQFIRDLVRTWGIRRRRVQFYVPDSLVIMKKVTFPATLKEGELTGHFQMELGRSLYLPFENPVIDVSPLSKSGETDGEEREGLLFAVPEEEIKKYADIFTDAGLRPLSADVRALGICRYFHFLMEPKERESYLFFELKLDSLSVSIFSGHQLEFLRFLELDTTDWSWSSEADEKGHLSWSYDGDDSRFFGFLEDQFIELERMINFYRYSIHKGKRAVSKILLLGDFPRFDIIKEKMEANLQLPVTLLDGHLSRKKKVPRQFIPALGLALKGGR